MKYAAATRIKIKPKTMEKDHQETQNVVVQNLDGTYSFATCHTYSQFQPTVSISAEPKLTFETSDMEGEVIVLLSDDITGGNQAANCLEDESTDDELWVNKRTSTTRRKDAQARLKLIEAVRANMQLLRDKKVARCVVWTKITQDLRKAGVRISRDEKTWSKVFSQWRKMNQQYRNYLERIEDPNNTQLIRQPGYFNQLHALLTETPSRTCNSRLIMKKRNVKLPKKTLTAATSQSKENTRKSPSVVQRVLQIPIEGASTSVSAADNGHSSSIKQEHLLERIALSLEDIRDIKRQKLKLAKMREKREELERKRDDAAKKAARVEMLNVFKELSSAIASVCESKSKSNEPAVS